MMKNMKQLLVSPSTDLYIGSGLPTGDLLQKYGSQLKIVIVADASICNIYAADLAKRVHAELLEIPSGEQAKSWDKVQHLTNQLLNKGYGKDTLLVAMGGGVTTDLVGFIASIYMRGVPLVLIPTTLLAVVDAAIGGKTAINTPFGKNLLGTTYFPKAILADLETLHTLPQTEWFNGLAEILKMGLIYDPSIWPLAHAMKDPELILKAVYGKKAIVEQDPEERGLRRILNFGHTIGHALEAVSQYELPHGRAVAIGCVAEARISVQLGYLSEKAFEQIQLPYRSFSLRWPSYARDALFTAMSHDKKNALGQIRCVCIDQIGRALPFEGAYCRPVSETELNRAFDWMDTHYG